MAMSYSIQDIRNLLHGNPNLARVMSVLEAKRDGATVEHVCPECGGEFAKHLNALIVVETCWACKGKGTLTSEELSSYLQQSRDQASGLIINAGGQ